MFKVFCELGLKDHCQSKLYIDYITNKAIEIKNTSCSNADKETFRDYHRTLNGEIILIFSHEVNA